MAILTQVGVLSALFILYKLITTLVQSRRFAAFAKQNGCAEPLDLSGVWYKRHQRLQRVLNLKNSGEDILDDIMAEDMQHATTISRRMLEGSRVLTTIEPANLQAMLSIQFKDFETGERRYQQLAPVLGRSVFTSDGAFWEHSRALFRPQFSRDNINDLEVTDRAAKALIEVLGATDTEGWTREVDMLPYFFNLTLDTASDFLFGESVDSQGVAIRAQTEQQQRGEATRGKEAARQATSQEFKDDLALIGDYLLTRIRLQGLYWLSDGFDFRRANANVRRFTDYWVNRVVSTSTHTKKTPAGGKKDNLLARLATQTQDREELRNQTLAILFAGRDTTAALLGFCFLRLALHPSILTKLRRIILRDFAEGESPISFAELKSCRYLQHFLNEVLRLHPTVPLNSRTAAHDTTLPHGGGADQRAPVAVRKGEMVFFSVYLMHRRKDLWGEDALEFVPERWERKVPAWQFLPFLGGPRICLGQQFALTEASYVLVRLLQHFDRIEPVDRVEMLKFNKGLGLTMWPGDGVKVRLHKA